MCMSSPKIPKQQPVQEAKQPDATTLLRKKQKAGMSGGTLLTSPSGVTGSALSTGSPTLLGA
jgi:hypothetical protein